MSLGLHTSYGDDKCIYIYIWWIREVDDLVILYVYSRMSILSISMYLYVQRSIFIYVYICKRKEICRYTYISIFHDICMLRRISIRIYVCE